MEHVWKAFDAFAETYDAQREFVVPELHQFYSTAVWAAESAQPSPKILDIGSGTGLLSAFILQKYPEAELTLIDFSEQMLDLARKRFAGNSSVRYLVRDYSIEELGGPYDITCSALSIHHLTTDDKRRLFAKIYHALVPGGMFVNADQVDGETPYFRQRFLDYWNDFLRAGPLTETEQEEILNRRNTLDRNDRQSDQVRWLHDTGFDEVDVVYKNRTFTVMVARKL